MSVSSTPLGRRSNSGAPTSASNAWMLRDRAGWVMCERGGGPPEVAVLGDGDEVTETTQLHVMPPRHGDDENNALDT